MARILNEPAAESPLWLEVAGYPKYLNEKIRKEAWPVFKKLVEFDCAANARPDVFVAPVSLIAERVGLEAKVVVRVIKALRKERLLRYYLPEDEEEEAMFEFLTPFHPPTEADRVRERISELAVQRADTLRYIDERVASDPAADSVVQQVVDAYLNTFGLRVNSFVLDELALLAGRFPLERIQNAFARAVQLKEPTLRRVVRDLMDQKRKQRADDRDAS